LKYVFEEEGGRGRREIQLLKSIKDHKSYARSKKESTRSE